MLILEYLFITKQPSQYVCIIYQDNIKAVRFVSLLQVKAKSGLFSKQENLTFY